MGLLIDGQGLQIELLMSHVIIIKQLITILVGRFVASLRSIIEDVLYCLHAAWPWQLLSHTGWTCSS